VMVTSIMDHKEYIERYLDPHASNEPSAEELLAISDHVASCKECESLLPTEHATRLMIQENVRVIPAPDALRQRILTSLDAVDRAEARIARVRRFSRPQLWVAAASLAACLTLIIFNLQKRSAESPVFDAAIASYVDSERKFVPTVGIESTDDLAVALVNQFGVPLVWDFSSIGLTSQGGRIDKLPDGKVVAYSLYKGSKGSLLCIINRREAFRFPSGDQVVKGIHIYRYKGYSIAVTDRYSVFCVMVTDLPIADLARAFNRLPV
jgi:hypothetical protein